MINNLSIPAYKIMNEITISQLPVYIYKITNQTNGKIYIGQTKNPSHRWSAHKCEAKRDKLQLPIYHAFRKYGIESFSFEIIEICENLEKANEMEVKHITEYDSRNPDNGYNVSPGGLNFEMTEETKKKISDGNKGKIVTEETREKISNTLTGIKHTEERKINISKGHMGQKSWNKGTKGIMKANSGTFKSGMIPHNKGKPSTIKGRKRVVDENGNITYVKPENKEIK